MSLRKPIPSYLSTNRTNQRLGYPVHTSGGSSRPAAESNLNDLGFSQFVSGVSLPESSSAFPGRVHHVVLLSAKKKMFRFNAGWIVSARAIVTHFQSFRNWSMGKLPRNAMRHFWTRRSIENPIVVRFRSSPYPAIFCFFYVAPKPFNRVNWNWTAFRYFSALIRTKMDTASGYSTWLFIEKPLADVTLNLHLKTFLSDVKEAIGYSRWLPSFTLTLLR